MPSVADKEARHTYEEKMGHFVETTPNTIRCDDVVPWPCNGTVEDMVAVMLSGEQKITMKKHIKELALFCNVHLYNQHVHFLTSNHSCQS